MWRRWRRFLIRSGVALSVCALLGLAGGTLVTHYLFQEPAPVTWSRYLMPEYQWQRPRYPSLRWAFDIVDYFLVKTDPRDRFYLLSEHSLPPTEPAAWPLDFAGPLSPGAEEAEGEPLAARDLVVVDNEKDLKQAINQAAPGTVIVLQPGLYFFSGRSLAIRRPGLPERPITLRAAALGSVRLQFDLLEGFHVRAPYWVFENLVIEGVCQRESRCEHAFHVVGEAERTVIRNNWVTNFNASVKVNGAKGRFPDHGVIANNLFMNEFPRDTSNPVTLLDIVAVSGWRVRKNVIADFAKLRGNRVSYGAFFKGGGSDNVFEQNLVRCEWRHGGGTRVGFSFGDGGTSLGASRDGSNDVEQRGGIMRANIIMNCPNDVGVYLTKSADTLIHNNLITMTRGIDVRFSTSDAVIVNNIVDGRILTRDGGSFSAQNNLVSLWDAIVLRRLSKGLYAGPERGDFRLQDPEKIFGQGAALDDAGSDICGQPFRSGSLDIGPIQYSLNTTCRPIIP